MRAPLARTPAVPGLIVVVVVVAVAMLALGAAAPESRPRAATAAPAAAGRPPASMPATSGPDPLGAPKPPDAGVVSEGGDTDARDEDDGGTPGKPDKKHKGETKDKETKKAKKGGALVAFDLGAGGVLEVHGRAFGRVDVHSERSGPWTSDLKLESARVGLRWTWREVLRVVVEAELARTPRVKDAYVLGRWRFAGVRVGNFKPPVSALMLEGRWKLPVLERGLLDDVLRKAMGIAGRRPGLQLELDGGGALDPSVHAGVFQASYGLGGLLDEAALGVHKFAARGSVSPFGVEIGAFGELRPAEPVPGDGYAWFWDAGLDVTWKKKLGPSALRVWGDVHLGSTWQDDDAFDAAYDKFLAGRAIVAWRYGGLEDGDWYGELYGMFGAVDPELSIVDDLLWEVAVGVNVGAWDRVRLTVELERRHASRNVPASLGLFDPLDSPPPWDDTVILVQVGGAF